MTISYHTYECSLLIAASLMYLKKISIGEVFKIAIFKQWQHHVLNMSNIIEESTIMVLLRSIAISAFPNLNRLNIRHYF